jgi:hypothetical protein
VPLSVFFDLLAQSLVFLSAVLGIALLLFENGCGSRGLVSLIDRGAGGCSQRRKDCK